MDPAEPVQPSANAPGAPPGATLGALGIRWPRRRLADAIARARGLAMAYCATRAAADDAGDALARAQYSLALCAALDEARALFLAANGWRVARSPFSMDQLQTGRVVRVAGEDAPSSWAELLGIAPTLPEYFRNDRQRPVAVIVHAEGALALASIQGLIQLPLPVSWHFPAGGVAYLLTRAPR